MTFSPLVLRDTHPSKIPDNTTSCSASMRQRYLLENLWQLWLRAFKEAAKVSSSLELITKRSHKINWLIYGERKKIGFKKKKKISHILIPIGFYLAEYRTCFGWSATCVYYSLWGWNDFSSLYSEGFSCFTTRNRKNKITFSSRSCFLILIK